MRQLRDNFGEGPAASSYSTLHEYWQIGAAVAIGCASILLSREALRQEFARGPIPAITVITVLATTLAAFAFYLFATGRELELARQYRYVQRISDPQLPDFVIIFVLALCFGALIAFVTNPLIYTATIVILQVAGRCPVRS